MGYALDVGLRGNDNPRGINAETLSTLLDLVQALFTRHVKTWMIMRNTAHIRRQLQHERALAHTGVAPYQHHASRDDATTKHAVELLHARRNARGTFNIDRSQTCCRTGRHRADTALGVLRCR